MQYILRWRPISIRMSYTMHVRIILCLFEQMIIYNIIIIIIYNIIIK